MNLDFSSLTPAAVVQATLKHRGQVGTLGTSASTRVSRPWADGDTVGTSGDGLPRPQVSPPRPQYQTDGRPFVDTVSPTSPGVPALFDQEAFEERAAIMEFDGGMTRQEAEAAARAIIGTVLAMAKQKDAR